MSRELMPKSGIMMPHVVVTRDAAVVGVSTVDGVAGAVDLTGKYLQKTDASATYQTKAEGASKTYVLDSIQPIMEGALFKADPFVDNNIPFRSAGANGVESVDMIKVTPENSIKLGSYESSVQGVEIHSAGRVVVVDKNDAGVETKYPVYSKRYRPEIEDLPFAAIGSYIKDSKGRTIGVTRTGINSDIKQLTQKVTFTQPVTIPDAVGDYDAVTLKQLRNNEGASKSTTINFKTVSDLVTGTLPSGETMALTEGMIVETAANEHGIKVSSKWRISAMKDNNTYSITLVNGLFANLILHQSMGFAEFGYGSTNPADNPLAVDEACRVARTNPVVHTLVFPSGSFQCSDTIRLDVDRRGFTFDGAGRDNSIILSSAPDISLHHVGIDPRNSTRDRLHWHQTVKGFTVNGQVESLGAAGARRSVSTAPYGIYAYKSINHRISNYDVLHLVGYFDAFSGGASLGNTYTQYGIRIRNNSNKVTGYIGGASKGCTVSIEGGRTSLTVAANAGDTTITVADATAFDTLFELGFGSPLVETKRIASINGNVITLDKGLTNSYASGSVVEVPCIANTVTNATIETGEIRIGDSQATYLAGNYSEEAKIYITKYVRALTITGMSTAEASPAISINVDKRSSIKIKGNDTTFSIAVNITDRSGGVGERIDLYNAPKLDISMNTRTQNPIVLNGVYGLSSLKIDKTFDTVVQDNRFTRMTFSGFNYVAPAGGASAEVMKFFQDATQFGFDGYTFDLDIVCRRDGNSSTVTPGILKRYGTSSAAPVAQNSAPVSLFADFNASTGYDVFIGASGNRGTIQIKSNPTLTVKAAISGTVTSVI